MANASRLATGAAADDRADAPMLVEASDSQFKCSFCGKGARQVRRVIASGLASAPGGKLGQGARICDECLVLCEGFLAEWRRTGSPAGIELVALGIGHHHVVAGELLERGRAGSSS